MKNEEIEELYCDCQISNIKGVPMMCSMCTGKKHKRPEEPVLFDSTPGYASFATGSNNSEPVVSQDQRAEEPFVRCIHRDLRTFLPKMVNGDMSPEFNLSYVDLVNDKRVEINLKITVNP